MSEKIVVLDFGSQYTQLIARQIRALNVYCEIHPFNDFNITSNTIGVVLSGGPCSVLDEGAPDINLEELDLPVLGICYGAQLIALKSGSEVTRSGHREYGPAYLYQESKDTDLFNGTEPGTRVWMSHSDAIACLSDYFDLLAKTKTIPVAAFKSKNKQHYGIQFHPEVTHTEQGKIILRNFVMHICRARQDWVPDVSIADTILQLKDQLGNDKIVLGLSGGVDSSVAATLIHRAVGKNLHCIFVDNGLLRKNEFEDVLRSYEGLGLNVRGVDARLRFYQALNGEADPERKRKIIGRVFVEIFEEEACKIRNVQWLGQGTIYPDMIESLSVKGPSVTIKSHHNVGGLPKHMKLRVVEPINHLFKDEVRKVGKALGVPNCILGRHPFPGPGLSVRILGSITPENVSILRETDHIFISMLKAEGLYDEVWQAAVILLPVGSVGVMGDQRTYEHVVALRAVTSRDGMTADWAHLPFEFLGKVSNSIINKVSGVNRVVYDISSKPPATVEWE